MFYEIIRTFLVCFLLAIPAGVLAGKVWDWCNKDRDVS